MASATLTVQKSSVTTGTIPTKQTIAPDLGGGVVGDINKVPNRSGKVRLHFYGAASATGQVTIKQQKKNSDGTNVDAQSATNALDTTTEELDFGPFNDRYNDGDGNLVIQYSGTVAGIKVSVIEDADQPGV